MNENKQELESKDIKSSTNPKETKQDSNNTESINQDSKKLDSNDDEIVWELRYKNDTFLIKIWILLLWGYRIFVLCGFIWIAYIIIDKLNNIFGKSALNVLLSGIIICLILFATIGYFISILRTLNTKRIYAIKKKLIIERFLGKNITFELESCYFCDFSNALISIYADSTTISKIGEELYNAYSYLDPLRSNNIQELYALTKFMMENYLSKINETSYQSFKSRHHKINPKLEIDFDKIDSLRKEAKND
ncbi:hypothetical protein CQA53_10210 [Helicobacter didelphidarum]|uniref:Uncharacterized protein n=1 Tax=Helicobacter didelphidarum TaxID=2040648 RepID=A0A3D8IA44_9HELI|nr:hypothetical protein [Helicobacter didelphidarum]RDU61391.1 hypothetical protein CQA53_10210 [Helicobacter didelphidarum]